MFFTLRATRLAAGGAIIAALGLLGAGAAQPAAATVYYDVYQGTGTTGTLLLGFQVPDIIPVSPSNVAIANVIGSEASSFPAGTDASYDDPFILLPNGSYNIFPTDPFVLIDGLGQYSVGLAYGMVVTDGETLVVSHTPPVLPVPEPSTIALLATGLLGLGLILHRRRACDKNH